ncbi:hypothetical protein NSIN_40060 [Nitrosotalea sinensis]|uniref:Uncharacterized protein n=1 Tax=Nitrosotalea sinensis TaxID=1499975 RepID=A0A2H1EIQ9_9ARCH|nr:hypothetical protein NSIN_40060 [Candidatus Nitrosotalea sinensis]
MELLKAANKLLLAARVGENPKNVSTGTTTKPPPSPIMEPITPATKPSGNNHQYSSNYTTKRIHHRLKSHVNLRKPRY